MTASPRTPSFIELLPKVLAEEQPARRLQGISEAIATGDTRALEPILERLPRETDVSVLAALLLAVGRLGTPRQLPLLANFIRHADPRVRTNAIEALYCLDTPVSLPLIVPFLEDADNRVRSHAAVALRRLGPETAFEVVRKMAVSPLLWMRASGAYALGLFDAEVAVPLLERCLEDASPVVRDRASQSLDRLSRSPRPGLELPQVPLTTTRTSPPDLAPVFTRAVDAPAAGAPVPSGDPASSARLTGMAQVEAAITLRDRAALTTLVERLEPGEDRFVTSRILSAIGILEASEYTGVLAQHLSHPDARVAANALWALVRLGDRSQHERVLPLLASMHPRLRAAAIGYFARDPAVDVREPLRQMLATRDAQTRIPALLCLGSIGRPDLWDLLDETFPARGDPEERDALLKRLEAMEHRGLPGLSRVRERLLAARGSRTVRPLPAEPALAPMLELPDEDTLEPPPGRTDLVSVRVPLARWRTYFLVTRLLAVATDLAVCGIPMLLVYTLLVRTAGGAPEAVTQLFLLLGAALFLAADPVLMPGPGKRLLGLGFQGPGACVPPWRQLPVLLFPWGLAELWLAFRNTRGQRPSDRHARREVVPRGRPKLGALFALWAGLAALGTLALSGDRTAWQARPADTPAESFATLAPAPEPSPSLPGLRLLGLAPHATMGLALPRFEGWETAAQGSDWAELRARNAGAAVMVAVPGEDDAADGWEASLASRLKRALERDGRKMMMWQQVSRASRTEALYRAEILGGGEARVLATEDFGILAWNPAPAPSPAALLEQFRSAVRPLPAGADRRRYLSPFFRSEWPVPAGWAVDRDDASGLEMRPVAAPDTGWLRLTPRTGPASSNEERVARVHRAGWERQTFELRKQSAFALSGAVTGVACELRDARGSPARLRVLQLASPAAWAEEWLEREAAGRPGPLEQVVLLAPAR